MNWTHHVSKIFCETNVSILTMYRYFCQYSLNDRLVIVHSMGVFNFTIQWKLYIFHTNTFSNFDFCPYSSLSIWWSTLHPSFSQCWAITSSHNYQQATQSWEKQQRLQCTVLLTSDICRLPEINALPLNGISSLRGFIKILPHFMSRNICTM